MLRLELTLFLLAVQFMTRLPVPRDLPYSDDLAVRSAKYYPLVGTLVGGIGAAVLWGAAQGLPMPVAVGLSLAATLLVTGAMHEDGLADTADGLLGTRDKDRALEIMRDSRVGTFGALALLVVPGLKVAALSAMTPGVAAVLLVAGHTLGRMATLQLIATTGYARAQGTKFVAPALTPDGYRLALAITLAVLAFAVTRTDPRAVFGGIGCAILAGLWIRSVLVGRLGGYTGDGLGATQQLCELAFYLGALWWLSA